MDSRATSDAATASTTDAKPAPRPPTKDELRAQEIEIRFSDDWTYKAPIGRCKVGRLNRILGRLAHKARLESALLGMPAPECMWIKRMAVVRSLWEKEQGRKRIEMARAAEATP